MDFLGQSLNQIRDLFLSMTPAARITSALLLGVILVSLGYLVQSHSSGPESYLFNGEMLDPRVADRVQAAIAKAGLTDAVREGNRFRVPRGQVDAYVGAVADDGALPPNFDTLMEDGLSFSPFDNSAMQRERLKSLRERKISMIVREMAGVEDAKVLFDRQEDRSGRGFGKEVVSATVSIRPKPGDELTPRRIKMIQNAVAGAIGGLLPRDVAILNLEDSSEFSSIGGVDPDSFEERYFKTRLRYEQHLEGDIRDLLRSIQGVRVQVSATLDETLDTQVHKVSADGEGMPIRETSDEMHTINERKENRGRPGLTANGPLRAAADENVAQTTNTVDDVKTETELLVPRSEEHTSMSGLTPKTVQASIVVPSEHVVRVWRENNPDAQPAEIPNETQVENIQGDLEDNIVNLVTNMFPKEFATNQYPNVKVSFLQSFSPDPIEPPSATSEALLWAGSNFSSIMMASVALVSLVMLRSLVKSIPPAEPMASLAAPVLSLDGFDRPVDAPVGPGEEHFEKDEAGRPKLKLNKGPSLKDDLTDIVREDPDAAAAILRSWIGNAG